MAEKSTNFLSNIHDNDYNRPFLNKLLDHAGMIFDANREKESLNGRWNFGIDQYDNCIRSKWYEEKAADAEGRPLPLDYSFDRWEKIEVPSCWNMRKEKYFLYEGGAVYTRKFDYKNRGEKRVFLKFGAVNYEAKVFLNRKFIGMHRGGSTPFYIEVTGLLEEKNRLLVAVNNTRRKSGVPGDNTDWFNYGGIYRDVELYRLPETFIRRFFICLVPGSKFREIRAEIEIDGPQKEGTALLGIPGLSVRQKIAVKNGKGGIVLKAVPELWSPENPVLYDVSLSYKDDSVSDRVGFREIRVEKQEILLNGKPVFLKGISTHEESVRNGKSISDKEIIETIKIAKELNCNFIRLAHYPHTERAAQIADEMGMMLWEEIPVYWALEFENPETYDNAENQLSELIKRDSNRAGVIIWSVGNENPDTDPRFQFMRKLVRKARRLDPSRLVSAACLVDHVNLRIADRLAERLDVIGFNEYYGWYEPDFSKLQKIFRNSRPVKPVIISEFGADARAGFRRKKKVLGTENYQLEVYKEQLETLGKIPSIKGITPWILYDFRCPRRLHFTQKYYNIKGLLTADKKRRKPAFYELKKFYKDKN